jgi:hypothetical protein
LVPVTFFVANKSLNIQNLLVLVPVVCYLSKFVDGDAAKQFNLLWRYSEELKRVNKGNTCKINVNRIGSSLQPRFGSFYFCLDDIQGLIFNNKKIHGPKSKNHKLTRTKIIFKPTI